MDDEVYSVSIELSRLRGEMTTGFAKLEGQLSLLVASDADRRSDIADLEKRVGALESRRWPLASMAAVSGLVSAIVAVLALLMQ